MSETPPAGWYPDPQDGAQQRYWDGDAWTEHTADGTPQTSRSPGAGTATGASSMAATTGQPDTWTWQSIVATIFCCLPLGIAGVLNAGRAEAALKAGDATAATRHSDQAKKWTLWAVGVGVVAIVLYVLFFVVVGLSSLNEFNNL